MRAGIWLSILAATVLIGVPNAIAQGGAAHKPPTREVTVAAASDLKFALDEILLELKREKPELDFKVTYGSSGNFFAQLTNKAPFDIYFSADIDYPRKLIENGLAAKGSEFSYAIGQIVLWVPGNSKIDLEKAGIKAVLEPSVKKVAIANPAHAPYGRAAEAALKQLGVYDAVKPRFVLGENIAQTAQFVESGAADIGVIAMSLAASPAMKDKGRYWQVPLDAYPALVQGGVILSWAKDPEAAKSLRDFVLGDRGQAVLRRYGFLQPGA